MILEFNCFNCYWLYIDTGCVSLPINKIVSSAYNSFEISTMNCAAIKYVVARVQDGSNLIVLAYFFKLWCRDFLAVLNYRG